MIEAMLAEQELIDTVDAAVSFTPEYTVGELRRRNYVGLYGDTLYIFTSKDNYTNAQAISIMREIQAGINLIQMDGGASTQFYSAYGEMRSNELGSAREVPTVLAVYRAE